MFTGTYTALVTPFRDGRVDEDTLVKLVKGKDLYFLMVATIQFKRGHLLNINAIAVR